MVGLDSQATKFVESRERMRARLQARSDEQITPLPQ
jgi:acyl-[acyl-carrier-protein] desaturase